MTITIKFNDDTEHDFEYFSELLQLDNYDEIEHIDCYSNNLDNLPELPNSLINIQHFCNPICIYINTYFDGDTKKYFEHHKKTKKQFINKIENWFLDCKYNPKYKYCRKRLMKEYDDLYN